MITFNLWELDQQAMRAAAAVPRLEWRDGMLVEVRALLPVAIVVPRGRRGWRR